MGPEDLAFPACPEDRGDHSFLAFQAVPVGLQEDLQFPADQGDPQFQEYPVAQAVRRAVQEDQWDRVSPTYREDRAVLVSRRIPAVRSRLAVRGALRVDRVVR